MPGQTDHRESAIALVSTYGREARRKVVDRIEAAIREHDLAAAKRWNAIGEFVDQRLAGARIA